MSTRKGRGAKAAPVPPNDNKKGLSLESPDLSAIDREIFFEGLQQNNSNPLHSTAIEEDLKLPKEGHTQKGKARTKELTQNVKDVVKTRPIKSRTNKQTPQGFPVLKQPIGKKPGKKSVQLTSAARHLNDQQMKTTQKRKTVPVREGSSHPQEETVYTTKKRANVLSSDEGTDEDTIWNPSTKKAKLHSVKRTQNTSSADKDLKAEKKSLRTRGGTELEAILNAFLDYCGDYKDCVASTAVKHSIACFSNNVKEQLLEKISSCKELQVLKRDNAKVGSIIHKKKQKLLDAKNELISAERQVRLLQKEKADLELRLEDMKRSQSFLRDLRKLNGVYLKYRRAHPKEKETYGASSLAALLLETKCIQGAERGIDNQLEKKLKGR
ncbi:centromere protein U isoform X2 [Nerophis ophidion]|uniref:centromere protein U isoform X2 n=1 Tax=Nerophis ophidion TaxID=159077 RepID=UPI002AE085FA|nr:centromere protein U isoform X2 [Nerophis ophidion]